jgi:hypothetical protein
VVYGLGAKKTLPRWTKTSSPKTGNYFNTVFKKGELLVQMKNQCTHFFDCTCTQKTKPLVLFLEHSVFCGLTSQE